MYYIFNRESGSLVTKTMCTEVLKCFSPDKFQVVIYY